MELIREELDVLQADLDDESPQVLAAVADRALEEGALDAHLTALMMKKGRPGCRIEVLCRPADRDHLIELLLRETSTLGVKARRVERFSLPRRFDDVTVEGHRIRVKVALADGVALRGVPEYEDCKKTAKLTGLAVKDVIARASKAWRAPS